MLSLTCSDMDPKTWGMGAVCVMTAHLLTGQSGFSIFFFFYKHYSGTLQFLIPEVVSGPG